MDEREIISERERATSGSQFVVALVVLLCLTGLTFGMHYVDLGAASTVIALGIAAIKVLVVGTIFMELRESLAATRLIPIVTVLFVVLLCAGIAGDVGFR